MLQLHTTSTKRQPQQQITSTARRTAPQNILRNHHRFLISAPSSPIQTHRKRTNSRSPSTPTHEKQWGNSMLPLINKKKPPPTHKTTTTKAILDLHIAIDNIQKQIMQPSISITNHSTQQTNKPTTHGSEARPSPIG